MNAKTRLTKLESAELAERQAAQTALDNWIHDRSDAELALIERDTAEGIRQGKLCGDELREFCRLAEIDNLSEYLETVPPPEPGDAEKVAALTANYETLEKLVRQAGA